MERAGYPSKRIRYILKKNKLFKKALHTQIRQIIGKERPDEPT
jgi:hypothetical protein